MGRTGRCNATLARDLGHAMPPETKAHDKLLQNAFRGGRDGVSRESVAARRVQTRPSEVASLMSHVSLAINSRDRVEPPDSPL